MNSLPIYITIFIFVLCYLIGSFPTAFVFVKTKHKKDIRTEGSGTIGTYNALFVSKSKLTGFLVLLFDLLKGALPVYLMLFVFKVDYSIASFASIFLILGHNYPVWLKFKGGRGLATGAGIFLVLNFYVTFVWLIIYFAVFFIKKNVLFANVIATFFIFITLLFINKFDFLVLNYNLQSFSILNFTIVSSLIALVVLTRHIEVFKEIFQNKK